MVKGAGSGCEPTSHPLLPLSVCSVYCGTLLLFVLRACLTEALQLFFCFCFYEKPRVRTAYGHTVDSVDSLFTLCPCQETFCYSLMCTCKNSDGLGLVLNGLKQKPADLLGLHRL